MSADKFAPNGGYCLYGRSFLANRKPRNTKLGAENLLMLDKLEKIS